MNILVVTGISVGVINFEVNSHRNFRGKNYKYNKMGEKIQILQSMSSCLLVVWLMVIIQVKKNRKQDG